MTAKMIVVMDDSTAVHWTAEFYGEAGNDLLVGNASDDLLDGGTGNDVLDGGDGNDALTGGPGHDVMIGGPGADRFYAGDGHTDVIFANDHTYQVATTPVYDVAIKEGGKTVFSSAGNHQYPNSTWHHDVTSDGTQKSAGTTPRGP